LQSYQNRIGRPQLNSYIKLQMQPTTRNLYRIQREMATHQLIHLGKIEEKQELEKDPQSSQ